MIRKRPLTLAPSGGEVINVSGVQATLIQVRPECRAKNLIKLVRKIRLVEESRRT